MAAPIRSQSWRVPHAAWPRLARVLGRAWQRGLALLYPPHCLICGDDRLPAGDSILLCAACRQTITADGCPACGRCGAFLKGEQPPGADGSCSRCRQQRYRFDGVIALGPYQGPLRLAVLRMKHERHEPLAWTLGEYLAEARRERLSALQPDVVIPIPMHWTRRLWRGVNNPDLLARPVARRLNIALAVGALVQCRTARVQGDLSRRRRFANVRGAFRVARGCDLSGAGVLLVDDVMTTGATCHEAAKACRAAGAAAVWTAVVARSELESR